MCQVRIEPIPFLTMIWRYGCGRPAPAKWRSPFNNLALCASLVWNQQPSARQFRPGSTPSSRGFSASLIRLSTLVNGLVKSAGLDRQSSTPQGFPLGDIVPRPMEGRIRSLVNNPIGTYIGRQMPAAGRDGVARASSL
jgi:hypothetical protein